MADIGDDFGRARRYFSAASCERQLMEAEGGRERDKNEKKRERRGGPVVTCESLG